MSQVIESKAFPSAIREKLRAIRLRGAGLAAGRSVAIACSVLFVAMILTMSLDWWLTILDTSVRTMLTTGSLVIALGALLFFGVRPVIDALGWTRAAENVDDEIPQLEERWTTVANFAHSSVQPRTKTEKAMLQQVTSEAVAMETLVRPKRVANPASLKTPLIALGVSVAAMAVFMVSNWGQTSVLLQRFLNPATNITATQLSSVSGDQIVPRGNSIELITEMTGLQRSSAVFTMEGDEFLNEQLELKPDADSPNQFICSVDVDESFRYQVTSGDGSTQWHTVTAIDFPVLSEVDLKVTAPEYVNEEPLEKTLIPGRIRAVQGSILTLRMRPDAPVEEFELLLKLGAQSPVNDGEDAVVTEEILSLKPDGEGWYLFETPLVEDFSFSPAMKNEHGLANENRRVCRIHVIADKAPVARVISPTDEMAVSPDEEIEIKFEAHDDHGIAKAELVIYADPLEEGGEPTILATKEIPLDDQMLQKHVMGKTKLDLKEFGLEEGTNISYSIRVTDNRDINMNPEEARKSIAANGTMRDESKTTRKKPSETDVADASDSKNGQNATDSDSANSNGTPRTGDDNDGKEPTDSTMIASAEGTPRNSGENQSEAESTGDTKVGENENSSQDGNAQAVASSDRNEPTGSDGESGNSTPDSVDETDTSESRKQTVIASTEMKQQLDAEKQAAEATEEKGENSNVAASDGETENGSPRAGADSQEGSPNETERPALAKTDSGANNPSPDENATDNESERTGDKAVASTESDGNEKATDPEDDGNKPSADSEMPLDENVAQTEDNKDNENDGENAATKPAENDSNESQKNNANVASASNGQPNEQNNNSNNGNNKPNQMNRQNSGETGAPRRQTIAMTGQNNDNQRQKNNRRRLRITERLTAVAKSDDSSKESGKIRERVIAIDNMLAKVEQGLSLLVDQAAPEDERSDRYRDLDIELEEIENYIADLRTETADGKFVFVGLQMVVIGTTHVTPARDGVFVSIRQPDIAPDTHAKEALHHVLSARELLADLLRKYDRVVQEKELEEELNDKVKMYEVLVEKSQQLLRAARQNRNPLKRKMAVLELDQAYLDRYAEVLTLRREMMKEFAKILADDPRLLNRYMDLIKRRRASLRDQLSELFDRQDEITVEVSGWLDVDENQRENLWILVSELRLHSASDLAKDAEALTDRIKKQMPLVLDPERGTAALVIQHAEQISLLARASALDAKKAIKAAGDPDAKLDLSPNANRVVYELSELAAALDQLNFESEDEEGVTEYVNTRILEARTVADLADAWAESAEFVEKHQFHGLAQVDQQQVAIATELLRVEMLGIEADLEGQFNQDEDELPQEIANMSRDLNRIMEAITFNQAAATFALSKDDIERAAVQQELAMQGFEKAQKLFDKLRRKTIEILDERAVQNPNVADLQDPTLDDFLARLEREPNIEAQLGLPNRPRNLRVIADSLTWQQNGGGMLGSSGNAAAMRARKAMMEQLNGGKKKRERDKKDMRELSEEEKKQLAEAKDMQEMIKKKMEESAKELKKQAGNEDLSDEERKKLRQRAEDMKRMLDNINENDGDWSDEVWDRLADAEQADAVLKAIATGGTIPDSQWNKIRSTLGDGLWQVRGRTPPEDYRKSIEQYQDSIRRLTTIGADNGE